MNKITKKDFKSEIKTERYKCANCEYIYDYTIRIGEYLTYAKECVKCGSTALDKIKRR
jgi:hypothetical protein